MKQEEIINEIIFNKELRNSPLLLSWILESEENRDVYIRYKNSSALMQSGDGMSERQILKDLEAIKKTIGRSKKSLLTHPFFKYAAILTLIIIGSYIYHLTFIDSKPQISMNEISVPEGSRSYITLPDGSEVILVNGSKVTYPSEFIGEAREIYLEGEAYLTVLQNYKSPFKVHLGDHQIEVLGTEFLVTAYPQDDLIIIDLISGKVKMNVAGSTDNTNYESYLLEPNESLILNKTNRDVRQQKTQDDFHEFWKVGEYMFKKESFSSLAHKLKRIYHVSIIFEDKSLESCEFTGALYSNSTIINTLETFLKASGIPFEYKIENNEVYIKRLK